MSVLLSISKRVLARLRNILRYHKMEHRVIKPLGRSIVSSIQNIRPPDNEAVFEDICLDIFRLILKKQKVKVYNKISPGYITYKGVSGDKQYGFDIKCKASLAVAQCKLVKDLYPSDLDEEVRKLKKYRGEVSHYFFLISNDRVKDSLQQWVDERNEETEEKIRKDKRFPVRPDICLPWFHILGWTEIKSHLLESSLLCMKWGALEGVAAKYPYLQGLDIEKIDGAIRSLESGCKVPPCSTAISGGMSLTQQLDIDVIARLGLEARVHVNTLSDISRFVTLFDDSCRVAQTYKNTMYKLESEDPITYSDGLEQLNTISYHSARIFVLPHLRQAYCAARDLVRALNREDFFYEELYPVDDEQGFYEIPTGMLIYNFVSPEEVQPPWYIDPALIQKSALRLVKELEGFRSHPVI